MKIEILNKIPNDPKLNDQNKNLDIKAQTLCMNRHSGHIPHLNSTYLQP